ncbi:hypothetical protein GCM10027516_10030 [Niabella aquatica]
MNATTLEKMRSMKLLGMYREFKTNLESEQMVTSTPDELIAQLVTAEWDDRHNRGIEQKIKNARFRYKAECLLITGSTGIGKSYIASALGYQACSCGYRVVYHNVPKLFS